MKKLTTAILLFLCVAVYGQFGVLVGNFQQTDSTNHFVFTIDNTLGTNDSTFTLPLRTGFDYDFVAHWGDDNTDTITAFDDPDITYNYGDTGTFQIRIDGLCESWFFNNGGDKNKMTSVDQWGNTGFIDMTQSFYGCGNLTKVPDGTGVIAFQNVSLMASAFRGTSFPDFENYNINQSTNFQLCFNASSIVNCNNNDFSAATNFSSAFLNASSLEKFENNNVSAATNFQSAWENANSLTSISGNDFTSGTDFENAVRSTANLGSFNFDQLGAPVTLTRMFRSVTITELTNVGSLDVTNLTDATQLVTSTLTTTNYDSLLNGWEAQAVQDNVTLGVGSSEYSTSGETARTNLINDHTWTINDGGCSDCP